MPALQWTRLGNGPHALRRAEQGDTVARWLANPTAGDGALPARRQSPASRQSLSTRFSMVGILYGPCMRSTPAAASALAIPAAVT